MNEIVLGDIALKYLITYKKNKNTYFYFKRDGYIQINASKYQKEKDILKFIKNNSESFILKYNKSIEKYKQIDGYYIWGIKYHVTKDNQIKEIEFNHDLWTIKEPINNIDHNDELYIKEEKKLLLEEASKLKEKYLNNGLVDISNIKIKTRATITRFGSCNYRLKTVNLNLKLVHCEKKFIEYVFLHEIAHLRHQNHSKDFYILLSKLCPNYKELKKELNQKFKR
ncbi:MAG: WLM domain protein [Candidatus Izimaplasma bacterium HR2]|nr:MAG: WLM domain protein [Candidatus Izimaplasma bacterium HR2]